MDVYLRTTPYQFGFKKTIIVYICVCISTCLSDIMFPFIFYAQRVCFIYTYISLHVFYVYGLLSELKTFFIIIINSIIHLNLE